MKRSRYVPYAAGLAALIVATLVIGLSLQDRNTGQVAASPSPVPATGTPVLASPPPATLSAAATGTPAPTTQGGSITGSFGYPSDFIPPVTVYAISVADSRVWYSVNFSGLGRGAPTLSPGVNNADYTIAGVAPGTYWIVAYRNDGQRPDPGYYSRQVECFRTTPSGPCPDVTLVAVTVVPGQVLSGVNVITWGPPPPGQPSPTFPARPTPRP